MTSFLVIITPYCILLLSLLVFHADGFTSKSWNNNNNNQHHLSSSTHSTYLERGVNVHDDDRRLSSFKLSAHYLTSALESVADQLDVKTSDLQWIDPVENMQNNEEDILLEEDTDDDVSNVKTGVPLYPLPAVYLPYTGVNHTLRNSEPRNIRMALDLEKANGDDFNLHDNQRFCVALRAIDTGRIATVGTMMRVVEMEKQLDYSYGGTNGNSQSDKGSDQRTDDSDDEIEKFRLIIVTCTPEENVEILKIDNPEAASREQRLFRSSEYLRATVRTRSDIDECTSANDDDLINVQCQRVIDDYNEIRRLFLSGVGTHDLPSFAVDQLPGALIDITLDCLKSTRKFWSVAQTWQTLCYTIREGRQIAMATDRNEMLVAAAIRKGGAVKLPIHVSDLDPEDRRAVVQLEVDSQQSWIDLGLDPTLDFQILLNLETHGDRLQYFANMIHRERQRLEFLASQPKIQKEIDESDKQPRKGAWFEDDW